jgi:hypothetical protein
MGSLPLIAVPHPLAGNSTELVSAKARAISAEIVGALTEPAAAVAARYARRFLSLTERRLERGAVCLDDACTIDPAIPISD